MKMGWHNPFSFRGSIGRVQFWLTLILLSVAEVVSSAIPVAPHTIILTRFGGAGESSVGYATPIEPVTAQSWALLLVFYMIRLAVFWGMAASMAKRLHDLGRSGKWVGIVFGGLIAATVTEALFSKPSGALSIGDVAGLIIFLPTCLIGAFGLFEMMFIRGLGRNQASSHPAELRRSTG